MRIGDKERMAEIARNAAAAGMGLNYLGLADRKNSTRSGSSKSGHFRKYWGDC